MTICVADYTSDKNKNVARMGHPIIWKGRCIRDRSRTLQVVPCIGYTG